MYNFCFEPPMDPPESDEAYNDRQSYYNRYYDEEGDI